MYIVHPHNACSYALCLEATEEDQIPLVEGEVIEQIEQVDEDWWFGVGAGGTKSGLFPG